MLEQEQYEKIQLKIQEYGAWIQADLDMIIKKDWANVKVFCHDAALMLGNQLSIGYKAKCAYRVVNEDFFSVPETWWQHFKKDVFPAWALRRWPVRYKTVEYKIEQNIPSLPVPNDKSNFFVARPKENHEAVG